MLQLVDVSIATCGALLAIWGNWEIGPLIVHIEVKQLIRQLPCQFLVINPLELNSCFWHQPKDTAKTKLLF